MSCNILLSVTYLLWRQLRLKKEDFETLFQSNKKAENDDIVLKLIKIFIEEKLS